jgi:hypothetical protein
LPFLTLEQLTGTYELTAINANVVSSGDDLGRVVERLLVSSIDSDVSQKREGGRLQRTKDLARERMTKVGDFVGKLLPLANVALGVAAAVGDVSVI